MTSSEKGTDSSFSKWPYKKTTDEQTLFPQEVWQRLLLWVDLCSLNSVVLVSKYFYRAITEEGTELGLRSRALKWFAGDLKGVKSWGAFFKIAQHTAHERLAYTWEKGEVTSPTTCFEEKDFLQQGGETRATPTTAFPSSSVGKRRSFPAQELEWMWNWRPNDDGVEWSDFCSSESWHPDGTFSLFESEVDYDKYWVGIYAVVHPLELDSLPPEHPLQERWEWKKQNLYQRLEKSSTDIDLEASQRIQYIPVSSSLQGSVFSARNALHTDQDPTVAGVAIAFTFPQYAFLDRTRIHFTLRPFSLDGTTYSVDPHGREVVLLAENDEEEERSDDGRRAFLLQQPTPTQCVVEDDNENSLWREDW